ncbi:ferrous iron transport protein b, putative [Heliomicrobium modesticaldum Ice1]|uniref:Ferrous iron transport protein b, putative n=1 Tax=Heliobacterium modesticaldum (strain ATCC 51547 / Ice1) TaxID=498761 RepID=B0TI41_HELMI|nr:nucleoside recognition domain-containing protein [Heliomicrobium modesticaldum]ABZ82714.1 ferrous iron transport protein b, putative [Heliomicrobium modesticaldum Ice1]
MRPVISPVASPATPPKDHSRIRSLAEEARQRFGTSMADRIVSNIYRQAESLAADVVQLAPEAGRSWDRRLDNLLTSRWFGYPAMLALLMLLFWLTIEGANIPSTILASILFTGQEWLAELFVWLQAPLWLKGLLVDGVYRCLAWVISVMLPPMAIFFPLFTLLEDLGYLPRVAFNMDRLFQWAGAHGKQSLTMSMGFGCNAAGVVACRIIDSPREKIIAALTNNFVPCNGRFPTLIALSTILTGGYLGVTLGQGLASLIIAGLVVLGVAVTLVVSWLLSKTLLKGEASSFSLELPPFRKPQVGRIIITSIIDRTLFVLWRAVKVAAPAGALIWLLANISVGNLSLLAALAGLLDPLGRSLGMDGFILLAFFLGLPANEIVLPILIMGYLAQGRLVEIEEVGELARLFVDHGWTWLTAVNVMLFSLLHFPCATTLLTMGKETGSWRWPALSFFLNTALAMAVCFIVALTARGLHLV